MRNDHHSRRKFIATLAATGAFAGTQLTPFSGFANSGRGDMNMEKLERNPDEPIRIVSTMKLTSKEIDEIKKAGKNIELAIASSDSDANAIQQAEVMFGYGDGSVFPQAKKLKWVFEGDRLKPFFCVNIGIPIFN